jgi:hypothetical protein
MDSDAKINSVQDLITSTEALLVDSTRFVLFRGQTSNKPLLPKIARFDPTRDTTKVETKLVREFRRRLARERDIAAMSEWDLLVYAQHHGLATRLLDWTTNPLVALWFACSGLERDANGYLFLLVVKEEALLDVSVERDPAQIKSTYVLRPNMNNSRIISQAGWFTVHRYSKQASRFVDLHKNTSIQGQVLMKGVPHAKRAAILAALDKLGVNEESVFPGPAGTAKYINWVHRHEIA